MFVNDKTIRYDHDKYVWAMKFVQSVFYLLVPDCKFIDRDKRIIFIKDYVIDPFLFDNLSHVANMVDHGSGPKQLIMKNQVESYFQHL